MKILIPLDGSKESEAVLPFVKSLVPDVLWEKSQFEITLLMVLPSFRPFDVPPIYYNEQELREKTTETLAYLSRTGKYLKGAGVTVNVMAVVGKESDEEIVRVAEEAEVDLIAMATHGRRGIAGWVLGSVAVRVMKRNSSIPMATVRVNANWEESIPLVTVRTFKKTKSKILVACA